MTFEQSTTSTESGTGLLSDAACATNQGRWPAFFFALLTAAIATIALVSQQLTVTRETIQSPMKGFIGPLRSIRSPTIA